MTIPLVDLQTQYRLIKDEIDAAIAQVLAGAAFIGGSGVQTFEAAFATYCDSRHCIGVGNGTDALFIALKTLGIGSGDEVITVANSFIATAEAITLTGAQVVFIDIDPQTYNIDTSKIEAAITAKTRAIIPVHLYGQPVEMAPILDIARRYDLKIIEDCAQAHGADYQGRRVGSLGDMGCFSFYPGKNLGAYGDAGAIVTDNDDYALKARMFANHGRLAKYDHEQEGINSRLDGIQAAVLKVKLPYLDHWTEQRRRHAYRYNELLQGTTLVTPVEITDVRAVYHLYVIRVQAGLRQGLQNYLHSKGIATGIHYPIALPFLKAYAGLQYRKTDFPVAAAAAQEILSLPIYPELEAAQIDYIAASIREYEQHTPCAA